MLEDLQGTETNLIAKTFSLDTSPNSDLAILFYGLVGLDNNITKPLGGLLQMI